MKGKLTDEQHNFLGLIALRPNGAIIRGPKERGILLSLLHRVPPIVSDVYEVRSGEFSCRITDAGREALRSQAEP
jgi:hypothetical protein